MTTAAAPTFTALAAHNQRIAAMLADPDCAGELLLVGIALARGADLSDPAPIGPEYSLRAVGRALYGPHHIPADMALPATRGWNERRYPERGWRRVLSVLRTDIRRYVPAGSHHAVTCGRPRVRTEGLCGRGASANYTRRLTDPATGERMYVGACSNAACRAWFDQVVARNKHELAEHPPPAPPANSGGVLERHLPEIDWHGLWRRLDESWSPPPEDESWHKPKLQLVVGDDEQDRGPAPVGRPTLTVLKGGW